MKVWVAIISIILFAGILWAGLVYGQEFKTDTENWYQDQIQQGQEENENTETEGTEDTNTTITVSASGRILSIN